MLYSEICEKLKKAGIENPTFEASVLLEKFCNVSRAELPFLGKKNFESDALMTALERRVSHEPLQYILGEWYFFGEKYLVDERCLIPRSDTEILVEKAIELLPKSALFADFCTGSGCIAISTLANREDLRAFAFEISRGALELAEKNASLNGVSRRITFMEADILADMECEDEIFDAILSNPPYIRTNVIDTLSDEVKKEPRIALDGGDDGLLFYRTILHKHSRLLKKNGFILFEIGYDQGNDIKALALENGFSCEIIKDLSLCDRVALLKKAYND